MFHAPTSKRLEQGRCNFDRIFLQAEDSKSKWIWKLPHCLKTYRNEKWGICKGWILQTQGDSKVMVCYRGGYSI